MNINFTKDSKQDSYHENRSEKSDKTFFSIFIIIQGHLKFRLPRLGQ